MNFTPNTPNLSSPLNLPTSSVKDFLNLTKPKIIVLVLFTSLAGMLNAPFNISVIEAFVAMLAIALAAASAAAFNMVYDRDIDAIMQRTKHRPIPSGKILYQDALAFAFILAALSFTIMTLALNQIAALLLVFSIFFYVVIYTLILKRSTVQNIVIGGAAGSFPPVIAYLAASQGSLDTFPILLFLIIFLWTPPHFWSLAVFSKTDYAKANIPMLPNIRGRLYTCKQISVYCLLLIPASISPYFYGASVVYLVIASLLSLSFFAASLMLLKYQSDNLAKRLFFFSNFFLFAIFSALIVDSFI